jgi:hypothetical protein
MLPVFQELQRGMSEVVQTAMKVQEARKKFLAQRKSAKAAAQAAAREARFVDDWRQADIPLVQTVAAKTFKELKKQHLTLTACFRPVKIQNSPAHYTAFPA